MAQKNVLAIIPARGGSKGIPGKNVRAFLGKPLIVHSIEVALSCPSVTRTVVSTDDDAIAEVASAHGAQVIDRPDELATDTSVIIKAIKHAVCKVEEEGEPVDIVVVLEPTSPMRRIEDIERCIKIVGDGLADSAAAFTNSHVSPHRLWRVTDEVVEPYIEGAVPFLPRQKQPKAFELTGQIYVLTKNILFEKEDSTSLVLGKTFPLITPQESTVDIDTELDFMVAEKVMEHFWHKKADNESKGDN